MEHKHFRIYSVVLSVAIFAASVLYDYFTIRKHNLMLDLGLKMIPVWSAIIFSLAYIYLYRLNIYVSLMIMALFLCFFGDLFLGLYDPKITSSYDDMVYFLLGGGSFFFARVILCINFMIKPFKRLSLIRYSVKKYLVVTIATLIAFIGLGVANIVMFNTNISKLMFGYIMLGMGLPLSYSFLRINAIPGENRASCIKAFIGVCLFNISDIILLLNMSLVNLPNYIHVISNNIYWGGLYLLAVSILRTQTDHEELNGSQHLPLIYTNSAEYTNFVDDSLMGI